MTRPLMGDQMPSVPMLSVKALIRNRLIKNQNFLDFSGIDYDIRILSVMMDRSLFVRAMIFDFLACYQQLFGGAGDHNMLGFS